MSRGKLGEGRVATTRWRSAGAVVIAVLACIPVITARADDARPLTAWSSYSAEVRLKYFGIRQGIEVGGPIAFNALDVPAGTEEVVVTSPALVEPIPLTPYKAGSTQFTQVDSPGTHHDIRSDIPAGVYPVTATIRGHIVATARLTVAAKNALSIDRFVVHPKGAAPCSPDPAAVRPGSEVDVLVADTHPSRPEATLTVKSPAFERPVTIKRGAGDPGCKGDDGDAVYGGHATVRGDVSPGRYPMTVVTGHQSASRQLTVAGKPVPHGHPWLTTGLVAAGIGILAALGLAVRRRRKAAASST
ncbi:hypothetical protein [Streptomyces luteireticuli]|uniref:hypothetical protein n=1 Tax=Streptomyces luteireticuli TaxID=173858 RepID=UPI0031DBF53D